MELPFALVVWQPSQLKFEVAPSAILGLTTFSISHDLLKDDLILLLSKFYCHDALIQVPSLVAYD